MSILVKICKVTILVQKIYTNLDFGQNFQKYRFWRKLAKNLKFGQICRKLSILVEIFQNISILVKIVGNSRFWSNYEKENVD